MKKIWNKFTTWQIKWVNKLYIEFEINELTMLWVWWLDGLIVGLIICWLL
mgnify:CR=1 FL=1